jgi:hypothetical protein
LTKTSEPPPVNDSAGEDYYLEIEAHFAARRETPFLFSAKDWSLMKQWHDDGIPLPVVIEAIDSCFDKRAQAGRKRVISSLSYCRHAVRELWDDRRDLAVGGSGAVPEGDAASGVESLAARLESTAAETRNTGVAQLLRDTAAEVRSFASGWSVPRIEEALLALEDTLLDRCVAALPAAEADSLRAGIETQLATAGIRDAAVRERTRAAMTKRAVRSLVGIPRLSLFG